jgi:parvulin-like peptidyl-prolyl isomerase
MPFWTRFIALLAALALAVAAAGCGGDGGEDGTDIEVPANAIAVVGDREISKEEYDRLLASAEKTYEAREQEFPAAGTPEFAQLRNAIVRSLVEQAQFEIAAEELNVTVSDEDVDKRLDELKEEFFQGDEQKYKDELEAQGLTEEQVKSDLRTRLLSEKVFEKVASEVEVTDDEVQAYYDDNAAQFETPASREVRHILVKSKARADQLHAQLEDGADFAKLARQYSQDPASKKDGGKFNAQQGATVAPFDKVAFDLDTGELSEPVKTQFGWHIIKVEDKRAKPIPAFDDVKDQIQSYLARRAQAELVGKLRESAKVERIPPADAPVATPPAGAK